MANHVSESHIQQAIAHHMAGRLEQAEQHYRAALQTDSAQADALHNLGLLLAQSGRLDEAAPLLERAYQTHASHPQYGLTYAECLLALGKIDAVQALAGQLAQPHPLARRLGEVLLQQGRDGEALRWLQLAGEGGVADAQLLNLQALALNHLERFDEALAIYLRALELAPVNPLLLSNLGDNLNDAERFAEALPWLEQSLEIDPSAPGACINYANALMGLGRASEARSVLERLLAVENHRSIAALQAYAMALTLEENFPSAQSVYLNLLAAQPAYPPAMAGLAMIRTREGRFVEAEALLRQSLASEPRLAGADYTLSVALAGQGRVEEAEACIRRALQHRPRSAGTFSNLLFNSGYSIRSDAAERLAEARRYGLLLQSLVKEKYVQWGCAASPVKLRVGFVGGDFYSHPVGFFLESVLGELGKGDVELCAYPTANRADSLTERLKQRFTKWMSLAGLDDAEAAALIHADGLHVLIDLAGHTADNRLGVFAYRPAPVQVSWLGYFATTGVAEMDYFIADPVGVPEAHQGHYCEKIIYLPETRLCFTPPQTAQAVAPLPALRTGHITFGCFQNLAKLSEPCLALWARVMMALPDSRLRLQAKALVEAATRQRLIDRLQQFGIAPERVSLHAACDRESYLAAHAEVDLILDTLPYNGGTTTCEALWMGVPTLTLAGETLIARQGASLLIAAGLADWVADSEDAFVSKAVALCRDIPALARLRSGLREQVQSSVLCDASRFAAELNKALWAMWKATQSQAAEPPAEQVRALLALFNQGAMDQAEPVARVLTESYPGYGFGWVVLGAILKTQDRAGEAVVAMTRAVQLLPDDAEAQNNLGAVLKDLGRYDEAEIALRRAVALAPAYPEAHNNLGANQQSQGRLSEAVQSLQRALTLRPDYAEASYNLGSVYKDMGRLVEAEEALRHALACKPGLLDAQSTLLFTLNYGGSWSAGLRLAEAHAYGAMVRRVAGEPFKKWCVAVKPKRLRVGVVSGDLRAHPVGYFLEGVLAHLKTDALELVAYSTTEKADAVTDKLRAHFAQWHSIAGLSDQRAAQRIHEDGIHILLDLAGHTGNHRLPVFARRPAPVQVSWLGYFATTGVAEMDYLLADKMGVPQEHQWHFTERVCYLPETRLCFTAPVDAPDVAELPALGRGYVTFGSFQVLPKISDEVLAVWSRVLAALPDSRLRLQNKQFNDPAMMAAMVRRLERHGIDPTRVSMHPPSSRVEYLAAHADLDLILDTFPYPGGTTTCEALWMGVPTLTLAGDNLIARQGASLLHAAGLPEWIAQNEIDFVAQAIALASNLPALVALRAQMRARVAKSALFDAERFARDFEQALWKMWREHPKRRRPGNQTRQSNAVQPAGDAGVELQQEVVDLFNGGHLEAAQAKARKLTQQFPLGSFGWKALGGILKSMGRLAEAIAPMQKAIALRPQDHEAQHNLASLYMALQRYSEAELWARQAVQSRPDYLRAVSDLGTILQAQGKLEESEVIFKQALALDPNHPETLNNYGLTLIDMGRLHEAVACLQQALRIKPDDLPALSNSGVALTLLGHLNEAERCYRRVLQIQPDFERSQTALVFAQSYNPERSQQTRLAEAVHYGRMVQRPAAEVFRQWRVVSAPDRLRIGLVSGDLYQHPVGFFLDGLLAKLDRRRIEVIVYATSSKVDAITERLRGFVDQWVPLFGVSDVEAAQRIHSDAVHVLFDLAGHTAHNRLPVFAWKPAPVQVSWLGYFATTGVPQIDYLLADETGVPVMNQRHFTETIWYLPETRLCFTPPSTDLGVAPLPALQQGYVTFGCFQNLAKVGDAVLKLWARVLAAVPSAHLRLQSKHLADTKGRSRLVQRLQQVGIDPGRVSMHGPMRRHAYLAAHAEVDIILDTFPYPGGTTTCEALWMGVPTLTLAGDSLLARQGASLLVAAGLPEWIAEGEDAFLQKAVSFASDLPGLGALREGLRAKVQASPLFDAVRFARHFEEAVWGMWQLHTEGRTGRLSGNQQLEAPAQRLGLEQQQRFIDLFNGEQWLQAHAYARQLTEICPQDGFGWKALGAVLQQLGDVTGALQAKRQSVALSPEDASALSNLGYSLHLAGEMDEAQSCFMKALVLAPDDASILNNYGNLLYAVQRYDEALALFERALERDPGYANAWNNLGNAQAAMNLVQQAETSFKQALQLAPGHQHALNNYSSLLKKMNRLEEAQRVMEQLLQAYPSFHEAQLNYGNLLADQGSLHAALLAYRQALKIKPDCLEAHSNLLFCLSYAPGHREEALSAAKSFGALCQHRAKKYMQWNCPEQPGRLRVGIVSGDLRSHPVGYFLESLLQALDYSKIELFAYSTTRLGDGLSERIKPCFGSWITLAGLDDAQAAACIYRDAPHILIDLAGHTLHNRLPVFAWKPAPVQVSWLGYFGTTGLPEMDYVLADAIGVTGEQTRDFVERVWYLPDTRLCFTPPQTTQAVAPLPALNNGYITFGCFQSLSKIGDEVLVLWARILATVPDARLRLQARALADASMRARVIDRLQQLGIVAERITLRGGCDREGYLAAHAEVDIVLDTFPYPGGTTTCEALWMGVPTLTMAGETLIARQGASLLTAAGLADWVADSEVEYVAKAAAFAANVPALAELRVQMRDKITASALFDAPRFAQNFESALWGMWNSFAVAQDSQNG